MFAAFPSLDSRVLQEQFTYWLHEGNIADRIDAMGAMVSAAICKGKVQDFLLDVWVKPPERMTDKEIQDRAMMILGGYK